MRLLYSFPLWEKVLTWTGCEKKLAPMLSTAQRGSVSAVRAEGGKEAEQVDAGKSQPEAGVEHVVFSP